MHISVDLYDLLEAATALVLHDHAAGPGGPILGGKVTDGVRRVVDLADPRRQVQCGRVRHGKKRRFGFCDSTLKIVSAILELSLVSSNWPGALFLCGTP